MEILVCIKRVPLSGAKFSLTVDGQLNENAAWYYAEPKDAAAEIAGRLAFWKGVTVEA